MAASQIITISLIIFNLLYAEAQKNPNFSENRSVILHLNEWKWTDIADECERYLQNRTFGGVQISPPSENVIASGRPWWERYQPVSYNLTTRSGSDSDLTDMILRCNKVGVRIYADAVFNHMAALTGTGTAGNKALSDVKMYPAVPYNPPDFHPSCNITSYLNPEDVRNCQINNLRDLDQSTEYVRDEITTFLNRLIDLGVAGFRVDSAKYMRPEDLDVIYGRLKNLNTNFGFPANSRPFIYQDVPIFDNDLVGSDEYTGLGTVVDSRFSTEISRVFSGRVNLTNLTNWGPDWNFIPNSADSVVFVDDHSNQRKDGILTYKTLKQYKMALSFMLAHTYGLPKIISSYFFDTKDIGPPMDSAENIKSPVIYSDGSCGNGYVCEHRWSQVANIVDFRNTVAGTNIENWWSDGGQQIAFSRGNKGFVAFSNKGNLIQNIQTSLTSGSYCDVISGNLVNGRCSGKTVDVDGGGVASVSILESDYDGVVAVHVNSKIP